LLNCGKNFQPPNTLDSQIDPGSACWRITFVVTSYETIGGSNNYTYKGSLIPSSEQAARGRLHAAHWRQAIAEGAPTRR
jgi:hypothetical protein